MTAKEKFMEAYKKATGTELVKDVNVKEFTKILNENSELRKLFREATKPADENATAGINLLFGN